MFLPLSNQSTRRGGPRAWRWAAAGAVIFALAGSVLWYPAEARQAVPSRRNGDSAKAAEETRGDAADRSDGAASPDARGSKKQDERNSAGTSSSTRQSLMASLTIFVLAVLVGFEVITKVPPTLHTPLMSGSNAISGITLVGALLVAGAASGAAPDTASRSMAGTAALLGFVAVVFAMTNVVGGFLVTHRMLKMFKRR